MNTDIAHPCARGAAWGAVGDSLLIPSPGSQSNPALVAVAAVPGNFSSEAGVKYLTLLQ